MKQRRNRIDIIAAVLKAASNGANKTRIMYEANLSFKLLESYLKTVMNNGFIQHFDAGYKLTDDGRIFLLRYQHFTRARYRTQQKSKDLADEQSSLEKLCSKNRIGPETEGSKLSGINSA
jgi:predicted transcriptional regulator